MVDGWQMFEPVAIVRNEKNMDVTHVCRTGNNMTTLLIPAMYL